MYDIIGDIHGHGDELIALLEKLGYEHHDGYYRHAERQALFLGDLIDRGNQNRLVIETVRDMVSQGAAQCIMGNHEFNAISFHTKDDYGEWLRYHSEKNIKQHSAFIKEFENDPEGLQAALEFFRSLPIKLDLGKIRLIHACWHPGWLKQIQPLLNSNNCLIEAAYLEGHTPGSVTFEAIDVLLKGHEFELPDGVSFQDKDGFERTKMRSNWWINAPLTIKELARLPEKIPVAYAEYPVFPHQVIGYPENAPPLFMGHYWESGMPAPFALNVACVDYSMGRGRENKGNLVAYRWDGETVLSRSKYERLFDYPEFLTYEREWEAEHGKETTRIWCTFDGEGHMTLRGWDMGPTVKRTWGDDDYEYSLKIHRGYIPDLLAAILKRGFNQAGTLTFSDVQAILQESRIPFQRVSWQ